MTIQRIMGLQVTDDEEYTRYRAGMTPILRKFGGAFGYDFQVSKVLISKTDEPINRVFTIEFPSEAVMDAFFSDPQYIEVQQAHFTKSVGSKTTIAIHELK